MQPGDTLSQIAVHFDVSLEELRDLNGVTDIDLIIPGSAPQDPRCYQPRADTQELAKAPPEDPELDAMFNEIAAAEGLNPSPCKAVAWLESGWQQDVVSPAGAVGFMQITPVTSEWLETAVFGEQLNEDVSTYDNVKMGARYLRDFARCDRRRRQGDRVVLSGLRDDVSGQDVRGDYTLRQAGPCRPGAVLAA